MFRIFCLLIFALSTIHAVEYQPTPAKRKALYTSIDPYSVSAHLAFFRLFPDTDEGKKALDDALHLLSKEKIELDHASDMQLPLVEELIQIVHRPPQQAAVQITAEELSWIDALASQLKNRSLKGFRCPSLAEVHALPSEEIDLGRALLLSQMGEKADLNVVRSYEAVFDLMALQIMARLKDMKPRTIIAAMNRFIFDEMHFRFPPESLFMDDVDLYTFLPSVVDSRRGVCLGVSILYLCLAQRIGLDMTIITPPGHIFVRYDAEGDAVNIETTARGIDMPDDRYLSLENRELQRRSLKEVVGMAHVNHASTLWHKQDNRGAVEAYQKALPYMPEDPLVKELLAYNLLMIGEKAQGETYLKELALLDPKEYRTAVDYLAGKVDVEGLKPIFEKSEKSRNLTEAKRGRIETVLKKFPQFRDGWLQLAVIFLQMDRHREALTALERFHQLDSTDPMAEYYLSALYLERYNYPKAWEHYLTAKKILDEIDYHPPALKELKLELMQNYMDISYEDLH